MPLPSGFQFSQASLQDYVACKRRFQLRHLLERAWPAVPYEPADEHEADMQAGESLHRLIHQHQLGLPLERLSRAAAAESAADDDRLPRWWASYLANAPADLPPARHPEIGLSTPIGDHRLIARCDLIAVNPGRRAVIVDWKTSPHRPTRRWLAQRLQTRVYRYVLAKAGAHLNGGQKIRPEQIELRYWFAAYPEQPERLPYDDAQHEADARFLARLVAEIDAADDDDYPKTDEPRHCRFCSYRSLCGRGAEAGNLNELTAADDDELEVETDFDGSLDFEQVAEIAF